jgi:hypothetical protein
MTSDTFTIVDDEAKIGHKSIINLIDVETKNILNSMKLLGFTALLALFSFTAFAGTSEIIVENGMISANFTSQPLHEAVKIIKKQSGVPIAIDEAVANESVTANFKNLPLAIGIKKLLEGTGINYAVIAGADGIPSAVLISGSEKPGAPPKKLDTRPTSSPGNYNQRSVVAPVNPPPQQQQVPNPREAKQPQAGNAPAVPNQNPNQPQPYQPVLPKFDPNNIPTGGSLVPSTTPTQPQPDNPRGGMLNQNEEDNEDEDEE